MDPVTALMTLIADLKAKNYGSVLKDVSALLLYAATFFSAAKMTGMHAEAPIHADLDAVTAHLESLASTEGKLPWASIFQVLLQILPLIVPFLKPAA